MKSYIVKECNYQWPAARHLILRLLTVADNETLSIAEIIRAGRLFALKENNIRVTMARLAQAELVEAVDAAIYRLGPKAKKLGADVAAWEHADKRVIAWEGSWIAVTTGGLPRSDRKILRARTRALSLLGFRELDTGLYIRPNNLHGGVEGIRARLLDLDLEPEAAVFQASHFDKDRQQKSLGLWANIQLESHYKNLSEQLSDWQNSRHTLDNDTALREAYLLGDFAIRNVVFDPLLPAPLVDEAARQHFFDIVRQFNARGRELWYAFFTQTSELTMDKNDDSKADSVNIS